MSESSTTLNQTLQQATHRLRWQLLLDLTILALGSGLGVTLLLLISGQFYPLTWPLLLLTSGLSLTLLAVVGGVVYALVRPYPQLTVAATVDQRLGLDERLSTALELTAQGDSIPPSIVNAQLEDTVTQLRQQSVSQAFPIQVAQTRLLIVGLLTAAITLMVWLPNPQVAVLQQQAAVAEIITEQAEQLEAIRADLLADDSFLETATGQEALETLDELIESLREAELSQAEALAALAEAEQALTALEALAAEEGALNELNELAEALAEGDTARTTEMLDTLSNELAANPTAAADLAEALNEAAESLQAAGNQSAAEALSDAAEALSQAGGDAEAIADALNQAAEGMGQAATPEDLAALQEALDNIQQAREQLAQQGAGATAARGNQRSLAPGENGGAGEQEGQGRGGGAGRGDPDSGAEGLFSEEGAPDFMETDNGANENRVEDYTSIAVPEHLGGAGGPLVNPEEQGAIGGVPLGDAPINPNSDTRPALVPYNEVYNEYNEAASEALDNSRVPLGMRPYIRDYFGALEPGSAND